MYRKIFLLVLATLLFSAFSFAQSVINVSYVDVSKLIVSGSIICNVYPSEEEMIKITGEVTNDANGQLSFKQKGGDLTIKRKIPFSFKTVELDSIVLNLVFNNIKEFEANSGAAIYFKKEYSTDKLTLTAASSALVSALVNTKTCFISAQSSGEVLLVGSSNHINIKAVSGASVNTIQTACNILYAESMTNAECYVRADELLDLKANSTGSIFYKGAVKEVIKTINTFGEIEKF